MRKSKKKSVIKSLIKFVSAVVVLAVLFVALTNVYMVLSVKDRIITEGEAAAMSAVGDKPDCIVVLGAAVHGDKPSVMLAERLDTAFGLYASGAADVLLFSGDNGQVEYNEVKAMRAYAIENGDAYGLTTDNIYLDHAGFSTYESMYRLKNVFEADSAIVVTQEYHLYRALYTAKKLGIDVYGVAAAPRKQGQFTRDAREVLARTKDFCYVLFDKQPKYLGDTIELVPGQGE
jgi:vancomycin permeability regulator SanA